MSSVRVENATKDGSRREGAGGPPRRAAPHGGARAVQPAASGLKGERLEPGHAVITLPVREDFVGDPRRPALHGGVVSALIDTTGGAAAWAALGPGSPSRRWTCASTSSSRRGSPGRCGPEARLAAQGKPRLPRADERRPRTGCSSPRAPPSTTSTGGDPRRDPNPPARARAGPPARRVHRLRAVLHLRGRGHQPAHAAPATRPTSSGTSTTTASTSTWTARASGPCTSRRAAATSAPTCGARSTSTGRTSAAPSTTAPAR